uniref:Retinoid-inducible serine carboxypeptidase, putative n=1 Tax=Oryza sativa subsp. japonica TaxID=39947 RepID=Q10K86_ORYSJ|nr:Retinoid-inducible serine carboxypeptidase precursor, putative [Oryza sativa Japonica Group]
MPPLSVSQPYSQRRWSEWLRSNVGGEVEGKRWWRGGRSKAAVSQLADSIFDGGHDAGSSCGRRLQLRGRPERAGDDGLAGGQGRRRAHIKALPDEIPALKCSPLYHVGESYGGKLAAMIGVSLTKSIHAGDLDLTLGGVVIRDGWISPTDFSLTYARLLDDVSRLDENAIDDANKLAEKVSEQSAAGQFAASLQTFTGLIDLIDKSSGGVNIFNFLFNTSGVDLRVLAAEDKQKEVRGSPLMRFVGQDLSGSSGPNTIEGIMNGVIKEKLKIIPNNLVWQLATVAVFNALENEFMKPAINEVDELLSLGVNVTVYNGQRYTHTIEQCELLICAMGLVGWNGLNDFFRVLREPMHYFCYPGHDSTAFRRIYKNLQYYWILEAGHVLATIST